MHYMYKYIYIKYIYNFSEWTSTLIKFLKDQLVKLQELFHQSLGPTITATEDQKLALKQWQYCTQLAKYLYEVKSSED